MINSEYNDHYIEFWFFFFLFGIKLFKNKSKFFHEFFFLHSFKKEIAFY